MQISGRAPAKLGEGPTPQGETCNGEKKKKSKLDTKFNGPVESQAESTNAKKRHTAALGVVGKRRLESGHTRGSFTRRKMTVQAKECLGKNI